MAVKSVFEGIAALLLRKQTMDAVKRFSQNPTKLSLQCTKNGAAITYSFPANLFCANKGILMAKKYTNKQKNSAPKPRTPQKRAEETLVDAHVAAWPQPLAIAVGLGIALVVLVVLRWHFIDFPLERDESAYAYLGKRLLEGQIPYRDFYEMKPPLLFYSYAALVAVFGYTASGIHWAALALSFWNAAWVMGIGARLMGVFYGFLACLSYVLLTANPATTANLLESELVLMGFVLPGIYCLLRWSSTRQSPTNTAAPNTTWWLGAAGFLLACGFLVKQSALPFFGIPALVLLLSFWKEKPRSFAGLVKNSLWFAGGAAIPVLASGLLMLALGVWDAFWFWNVEYLQVYSAGLNQDLWATAFVFHVDLLTKNFGLYWVLAGTGLLALLTPVLPTRNRLFLFSLLLFSFAAVMPGWRFYTHYWLQFFPVVALLMAAFFYQIEKGGARLLPNVNLRPVMAGLAVVVLFLPVLQNSVLLFKSDHDRVMRSLFPGNPYPEDKVLANFIAGKRQPGDRVAVLGSEPQYYVYLDEKAPSKHFYMAFCMRPIPQSEIWQQEALDSIVNLKPRFIVFNFVEFSWMPKKNSKMLLYEESYRFARQHYRPVAWADMLSLSETKFVLDEANALTYAPTGKRYVTVYERIEQ